MVDISPQQEIYTAVRMLCVGLGYDVYDYRPDNSAGYPFVDMGEQFEQRSITNKDRLFGNTQITIHVWHNDWRKRGTLTNMMSNIESELWRLKSTARFSLRLNNTNKQVLVDTSTSSTLLHGIIEADITYQ